MCGGGEGGGCRLVCAMLLNPVCSTGTSQLHWNVPLFHLPLQMVNYCTREYCIELLMLWLDVEHFRGFDGDQEDLTLMAQHLGEQPVAHTTMQRLPESGVSDTI